LAYPTLRIRDVAQETFAVPIPDFQTLMLPLLEGLSRGEERLMRDVTA
jgi:hypothetical protein